MSFNFNMLKNFSIDDRLKLESLRRGINGAYAQITLLFALILWVPTFPESLLYRTVCIALTGIFIWRYIYFKRNFHKPEHLKRQLNWQLYLGASTSFFWVLLIGLAIHNFSIFSTTGIVHVLLGSSLLSSVMYSLAPTPILQRIYIIVLGSCLCTVMFSRGDQNSYATAVCMIVYVLYLFFASKGHTPDVRAALVLEEKLTKENQKLQAVFNTVPGFIILADTQGNWIQQNESAKTLSAESKLGMTIDTFREQKIRSKTIELELENTQYRFYIVSLEKIDEENLVVAVGLPIGELKKTQSDLEVQKANAEYAARLAAIGEMAAGIAHEINNPISIIDLSAQRLARKLKNSHIALELWQKPVQDIDKTVQRITLIVQSLKRLARDEISDPNSVDLNQMIKEVLNITSERMRNKSVSVTYNQISELFVYGNHVELGQVMINLINNAFDAVDVGGSIKIEVKDSDKKVTVFISDTGPGIKIENQTKIFQPFFTTKPVGQGTGLGLSISRSILLKYNGDLDLISSCNPTTFKVTLAKAN